MTVAFKLWLLAVVCVAFLYQDGPRGNGVSCRQNVKNAKSDVDKSFGASSDATSGAASPDEEDENQNSEDQSGSSGGGSDSQGGSAGNGNDVSSVEEDDDGDDDDDSGTNTVSNHNKHKHGEKSKSKTKHETHKKSGKGNNHQGHHDDEDVEDDDDDEDPQACYDGDDDDDEDMQVYSTTTIKGKPKDILRFLNAGVKPYKSVFMDFNKKSNSKLFKKIESITKSGKLSKGRKEPKDDLTSYIRNIIKENSKKRSAKQVDPDKILITLAKTVLLQLLKDI